jgi:probable addiction module antidote protein
MKQRWRTHDEAMAESFRKDPEFAADLLTDVIADGDEAELLILLRQLSKAFGGVTKIAARSGLNATSLYRTLSRRGNPELKSFTAILKAMGMQVAIRVAERPKGARPRRAA